MLPIGAPDFFSSPDYYDAISHVVSYSSTDLENISLVSHALYEHVTKDPMHILLSLADVNTISSATITSYQTRMEALGTLLTCEQAIAHCLRDKRAIEGDPQSTKLSRIHLSACTLNEELIDALIQYGTGVTELELNHVVIPHGQRRGLGAVLSKMTSLQQLTITDCASFNEALDLSFAPGLEVVKVINCRNLQHPPIFPPDSRLAYLDILQCPAMTSPPDLTYTKHLACASIIASGISTAPGLPYKGKLRAFSLSSCPITEPPDLTHMRDLQVLVLNHCPLKKPPIIPPANALEILFLKGCKNLRTLDLRHAIWLKSVFLNGSGIERLIMPHTSPGEGLRVITSM